LQETQVGLWWCLWRGLAESAFGEFLNLESGGPFGIGAFGENLVSVAVKKHLHLIYFIKKFCKLCTLKTTGKGNGAINCLTLKHVKCSFL
jgi:hypothetical protein